MSALLDALDYVGGSLEKPGRAVRGLLAGRPHELLAAVPFSDALGLTDEADRVTGRDLLHRYGLDTGSDTADALLGFGADLLTDPTNYLGGAVAARLGLGAARLGTAPGLFDAGLPAYARVPPGVLPRLEKAGFTGADTPLASSLGLRPGEAGYDTLFEANALANKGVRERAAADVGLPDFPDPESAFPQARRYVPPPEPPAYSEFETLLGPSGHYDPLSVAPLDGGEPMAGFVDPARMQAVRDAMENAPSLAKDLAADGFGPRPVHEAVTGLWDDALARMADIGPIGLQAVRRDPDWKSALTRRLAEIQAARVGNPVIGLGDDAPFWEKLAQQQSLIEQVLDQPGLGGRDVDAITRAFSGGRQLPLDENLSQQTQVLRDIQRGSWNPGDLSPDTRGFRAVFEDPMFRPDPTLARRAAGREAVGQAADWLEQVRGHLDSGLWTPEDAAANLAAGTGEVAPFAVRGAVRTSPAAAESYSAILRALEAAGVLPRDLPLDPRRLQTLLQRHGLS